MAGSFREGVVAIDVSRRDLSEPSQSLRLSFRKTNRAILDYVRGSRAILNRSEDYIFICIWFHSPSISYYDSIHIYAGINTGTGINTGYILIQDTY